MMLAATKTIQPGWFRRAWPVLLMLCAAFLITPLARAAEGAQAANAQAANAQAANAQATNGTQVLEAFDRQQVQRVNQASELSEHKKHLIMFILAVPLLILLLITGGLGIATGVFGKQLYIAHMIFAG